MARAVLPPEPGISQEGKRASKGTAPPEAERSKQGIQPPSALQPRNSQKMLCHAHSRSVHENSILLSTFSCHLSQRQPINEGGRLWHTTGTARRMPRAPCPPHRGGGNHSLRLTSRRGKNTRPKVQPQGRGREEPDVRALQEVKQERTRTPGSALILTFRVLTIFSLQLHHAEDSKTSLLLAPNHTNSLNDTTNAATF